MVQHYYFSNLLIYTIDILLCGTFFSYVIYFFSYKNQYQNIVKHDTIYNTIKLLLTITLGLSFIFFIFFLVYFYSYYSFVNNYSLFNTYLISPKIYANFFLF